jgi:hypothetical protein
VAKSACIRLKVRVNPIYAQKVQNVVKAIAASNATNVTHNPETKIKKTNVKNSMIEDLLIIYTICNPINHLFIYKHN